MVRPIACFTILIRRSLNPRDHYSTPSLHIHTMLQASSTTTPSAYKHAHLFEAAIQELQEVAEHRDQLEKKLSEMAAARLESGNKIGAALSMKQAFRTRGERDHARRKIGALQELLFEASAWGKTKSTEYYQTKIKAILSVESTTHSDPEFSQLLDQAQMCLHDMDRQSYRHLSISA